jgi:hypothetical protein
MGNGECMRNGDRQTISRTMPPACTRMGWDVRIAMTDARSRCGRVWHKGSGREGRATHPTDGSAHPRCQARGPDQWRCVANRRGAADSPSHIPLGITLPIAPSPTRQSSCAVITRRFGTPSKSLSCVTSGTSNERRFRAVYAVLEALTRKPQGSPQRPIGFTADLERSD